jgi:hypothetical protein
MQRSSTLGMLKRHDTWKWTNGITIFGPEDPDVAFQHAPSNNLINANKTFPKYARLEPNGNLKTYLLLLLLLLMRSATSAGRSDSAIISSWELNLQAFLSLSEFPNACGPYGISSGAYSPTQKCTGCPTPGFIPITASQLDRGCKPALKQLPTGAFSSSPTLSRSRRIGTAGAAVLVLDHHVIQLTGVRYSLLQSLYWGGDLVSNLYQVVLW